jgi:hypothetical protein
MRLIGGTVVPPLFTMLLFRFRIPLKRQLGAMAARTKDSLVAFRNPRFELISRRVQQTL